VPSEPSSARLASIIGSYVRQIYSDLLQAHRETVAALDEPPPVAAAERPFALAVLEQIIGALAACAARGLSALLTKAVEDRLGADARVALSRVLSAGTAPGAALAMALSAGTGAAPGAALAMALSAEADAVSGPIVQPARPRPPRLPRSPIHAAAPTLLAEFASRQEVSLREQEARVERRLLAAGAAMRRSDPASLRTLAEALARKAESAPLCADYARRACEGWLQLCSAISLGPRAPGELAMPAANRIGGAPLGEWRRAHAGFLEIEIDFPDEIDGLTGAAVGKITLAGGPGAARILRQSGRTLGELAVYRRLWLGTHRQDRAPDVVIAPDHGLEVNASSSLLAAIGARTRSRLRVLAAQGPGEEHERARLIARRARAAEDAPQASPEPDPSGLLMGAHPPRSPEERAAMDEERLSALNLRRQIRAAGAYDGAGELWAWVGNTSCDRIS
jgi:hypothetical protein